MVNKTGFVNEMLNPQCGIFKLKEKYELSWSQCRCNTVLLAKLTFDN